MNGSFTSFKATSQELEEKVLALMEAPDWGLPSRSSRASELEMIHRPLLEKMEDSDNEDDEGDCITEQPETSNCKPVMTESSFEHS